MTGGTGGGASPDGGGSPTSSGAATSNGGSGGSTSSGATSSGASDGGGGVSPGSGGEGAGGTSSIASCGEGVLQPDTESCDDGNLNPGDGCDDQCVKTPGWYCPTANQACVDCSAGPALNCPCVDADYSSGGYSIGDRSCNGAAQKLSIECDLESELWLGGPVCPAGQNWDGKLQEGEVCDDGNETPADGCEPASSSVLCQESGIVRKNEPLDENSAC